MLFPALAGGALVAHSFLDGLGIGVTFAAGTAMAVSVTIAMPVPSGCRVDREGLVPNFDKLVPRRSARGHPHSGSVDCVFVGCVDRRIPDGLRRFIELKMQILHNEYMQSDITALIESASDVLRAHGERMTEPRRAVLSVLAGRHDHLTSEQILQLVRSAAPSVHRASVYRALETLSTVGLLQHIHVAHGGTVYHLRDRDSAGHLHAQCRRCGAIFDLLGDPSLMDQLRRTGDAHNFEIDPTHIAFSGLCKDCAATTDALVGHDAL